MEGEHSTRELELDASRVGNFSQVVLLQLPVPSPHRGSNDDDNGASLNPLRRIWAVVGSLQQKEEKTHLVLNG